MKKLLVALILLLAVMGLFLPAVPSKAESIQFDGATISFEMPPGYEVEETETKTSEAGIPFTELTFKGSQVKDDITTSWGSSESYLQWRDPPWFGTETRAHPREYPDIAQEAAHHVLPYVPGDVYTKGAMIVPGDGAVTYQGYYYLSRRLGVGETAVEQGFTPEEHFFNATVALTNTPPYYTMSFWGGTWGVQDGTVKDGSTHVHTLDGEPLLARQKAVVEQMLFSVTISDWTAPSTAPVTTPELTPVVEATLDQSQTSIPGNTGLEGDWWLSQGFIPSMPILTAIEVYVGTDFADLSNPLTLQIRGDSNGLPSVTVLASTSVTIARKGWNWVTFDLPDLTVNSGTSYHLVLSSTSNYHAGLDSTNPYPHGYMGYSADAGATWKTLHDTTNYDMAFKIYGTTPEETPEPQKTGGGFFSCSPPPEGAVPPSQKGILAGLGGAGLVLGVGLWFVRRRGGRPE